MRLTKQLAKIISTALRKTADTIERKFGPTEEIYIEKHVNTGRQLPVKTL